MRGLAGRTGVLDSPLCPSTFAASQPSDLVFVIVQGIDSSGRRSHRSKRHSWPLRSHICPGKPRKQDDWTPLSCAPLAFVSLFHPSLSSWPKAAQQNALSPMAMVQFRRFSGRDRGTAPVYQQMSTGLCSLGRVSKNKSVFNKHQRKHTTTRKEGPS